MTDLFARSVVDQGVHERARAHFRANGVRLPKLSELADPARIDKGVVAELAGVDPDAADPRNLYRVHWHNDAERQGLGAVPQHLVLPESLTGVKARIIVALGDRFPMIGAHKVLAAYGCLVPRLVTGQFDPQAQRAVWPSTGNYCRGGVAISTILGCRSVAVLPEGMSAERFSWLEAWTKNPSDIVRTPGSESNLKEIYDACHELAKDPQNVILNQFSEFGNYVTHRAVTGPALEAVFRAVKGDSALRARAFVCASGSSGTLAAGDHLKDVLGAQIAAVEATECPTLLRNGYGEHNIQGIGDKHIPLIHNAFNTDYVIGVSDHASDVLNVLFNTEAGRAYLAEHKGLDAAQLAGLGHLGLSSIANIVAAIKLARYLDLGADDAIVTIATDGAVMYGSQLDKTLAQHFPKGFGAVQAAEAFGQYLAGIATDEMQELSRVDKERIFNLGYYTWVEQQGVSLEAFDARRQQSFWDGLMAMVPIWDELIDAFNAPAS
ncbi:pyridoxal-5'-phosphate-dependent protein subunit beta [Devosia limi DSM 17137]|uniref:Cysteine synthase n=1 Tax=Devosia limi DSM 17137 TaxID=1121477 RepID=A0A0F5LWY1_9HYPH|nr:pyridoxal-phosphate dependent enzyme [Devosia limi]KKB86679.1 pyridoxal-5'-phosphate-dependent protein subunit beta [Devosia limi DSM 17137]SHE85672.1 Cysteine synthase [Devosia limi DSM 17137]